MPDAPEVTADETDEAQPETDWQAEARKWERRAKDNQSQIRKLEPKASAYDALEAASKTVEERAQEAVKAAEARTTAGFHRIAKAEIKAALTGVVANPAKYVDRLNLALYVDADGDVDADAVEQLRAEELADRQAEVQAAGQKRSPRPDSSQASGANGRTKADPREAFAAIIQGRQV